MFIHTFGSAPIKRSVGKRGKAVSQIKSDRLLVYLLGSRNLV